MGSSSNGDLQVSQYLTGEIKFTQEDAGSLDNAALRGAAINGQLAYVSEIYMRQTKKNFLVPVL